jgi:3-deoxy-manno-octulosonate cytidylyltransferase (CMP-KDO synthetase)
MPVITVIPARLAATRFPNKPLADILGSPMIVHVWRRAIEANIGPVVVACGDRAIADAIDAVDGWAVMTDPDLPSGSDRVHAALAMADPVGRYDIVVNLQGDLPLLDPKLLTRLTQLMTNPDVDIGTLATPIHSEAELHRPSFVKVAIEPHADGQSGRALYFSRAAIPSGQGEHLHHIGLYAFRRAALDRFVSLPPAAIERREGLEQLRALAAGMRIDVALIDDSVFGVDTPEDLALARQRMASV